MAKAIHSMIRVAEEQRSLDFYRNAFGLEVNDRFGFDTFALIYLKNKENDFEIELTVNFDNGEDYTHGTGYGHLAVSVDDVRLEHARLTDMGHGPTDVKEFHVDGSLLAAFCFVTDPDGYKIEIIERHGRFT